MLVDKDNKCAGLRNTNNNEINLEEGSCNSNLMDCGLNIYVLFGYYCFKLNIYIFLKKIHSLNDAYEYYQAQIEIHSKFDLECKYQ